MSLSVFKQFKNILGEVGTRQTFLNVVILDNVISIGLAVLISYFFKIPFPLSIIGVYVTGIIIHILFGVNTSTIQFLNINVD